MARTVIDKTAFIKRNNYLQAIGGREMSVYEDDGATLADVYDAREGGSLVEQPLICDADGRFTQEDGTGYYVDDSRVYVLHKPGDALNPYQEWDARSGPPGPQGTQGASGPAGPSFEANYPVRTNYDPNPVGAVNTSGLTDVSGTDIFERGTLGSGDFPAASADLTALGITTAFRAVESSGSPPVNRIYFERACTVGEVMTFSKWMYAESITNWYRLNVRDTSDATVKSGTEYTTLGSWYRRSMSFTAPATATYRFTVDLFGNGEIFWTGGMLEVVA